MSVMITLSLSGCIDLDNLSLGWSPKKWKSRETISDTIQMFNGFSIVHSFGSLVSWAYSVGHEWCKREELPWMLFCFLGRIGTEASSHYECGITNHFVQPDSTLKTTKEPPVATHLGVILWVNDSKSYGSTTTVCAHLTEDGSVIKCGNPGKQMMIFCSCWFAKEKPLQTDDSSDATINQE